MAIVEEENSPDPVIETIKQLRDEVIQLLSDNLALRQALAQVESDTKTLLDNLAGR